MSKLVGWSFPVDVDPSTGKIQVKEDNDMVKQNVKIILKTQKGERHLRPYFGTDTNQFMFASVDPSLTSHLSEEIRNSIDLWEEHVKELNVDAIQSPKNNSLVKVEISYVTDLSPEEIKISKVMNRNDITD